MANKLHNLTRFQGTGELEEDERGASSCHLLGVAVLQLFKSMPDISSIQPANLDFSEVATEQ
jgi:hypothetical protein